MIFEKVIGNLKSFKVEEKEVDYIEIEWFETNKKILKKTTKNGLEIGLRLNEELHHNDILYSDDKKVIVVKIKESELIKIHVHTMVEMGTLCFELGNRHLQLCISENTVIVPFDNPTYEYLKKLGFHCEKIVDVFTGITECRGHAH